MHASNERFAFISGTFLFLLVGSVSAFGNYPLVFCGVRCFVFFLLFFSLALLLPLSVNVRE
jgi:hypothetical protein